MVECLSIVCDAMSAQLNSIALLSGGHTPSRDRRDHVQQHQDMYRHRDNVNGTATARSSRFYHQKSRCSRVSAYQMQMKLDRQQIN